MVDFWVKIEFDELDFVILPVSVLKKYTRKNEFIASTTNMIWSSAPSLTRFDQVQTQPSSADAARSDQVRHQVLDTIWSWRSSIWSSNPLSMIWLENEFNELVFLVYFFSQRTQRTIKQHTIWSSADAARATCWGSDKKTSSLNLFSMNGKRVHWTRFLIRSSAGCSGCICTWSDRV